MRRPRWRIWTARKPEFRQNNHSEAAWSVRSGSRLVRVILICSAARKKSQSRHDCRFVHLAGLTGQHIADSGLLLREGQIGDSYNAVPHPPTFVRIGSRPVTTLSSRATDRLRPAVRQREGRMNNIAQDRLSKVPAVTFGFWIIKILATTLGETGGDAVTMSLNLGYLIGTAIFAAILVVAVSFQIKATCFHPFLYWFVIVATTTAGTTLADFCDRSLGLGYTGGSSILFVLLMATFGLWYWLLGSVSVDTVVSPKAELFYWASIMFSQTLGTALGDFLADSGGLGYENGALVFASALLAVAGLYFRTRMSRTTLFWAAFILTRPLGATVGDLLDKPVSDGGLALGRFEASGILAAFIILCIMLVPQRAGRHPGAQEA
jgi:uncharacterized membrane-anchored protein